tara:strand:- start:737 stop:970 length:234 start_codon:yes stop_codon:yes gene_type:complete
MTITGETVDEALFAALRERFSEAEIVELTAGIAMENFRSKFNVPLQVSAQGLCILPATSQPGTMARPGARPGSDPGV